MAKLKAFTAVGSARWSFRFSSGPCTACHSVQGIGQNSDSATAYHCHGAGRAAGGWDSGTGGFARQTPFRLNQSYCGEEKTAGRSERSLLAKASKWRRAGHVRSLDGHSTHVSSREQLKVTRGGVTRCTPVPQSAVTSSRSLCPPGIGIRPLGLERTLPVTMA